MAVHTNSGKCRSGVSIRVPYPEADGLVLLSDSTAPGGFRWGDFAQGPQGPRGLTGPEGPKGARGLTGDTGATGLL